MRKIGYQIYCGDQLLGVTDTEFVSPSEGQRIWRLIPSDAGLAVLPLFSELTRANSALGDEMTRIMEGDSLETEECARTMQALLETGPAIERVRDAARSVAALGLELRHEDEGSLEVRHIFLQALHEFLGTEMLADELQSRVEAAGGAPRYVVVALLPAHAAGAASGDR